MQRALKDGLAGAVFVAFGVAFAGMALTYELGTALNMGPGYFPLMLGGLLVALGLGTVAKGFIAPEEGAIGSVPWKAAALIVAAVLFFGLTVRGLGLIPTLFVTVVLAALASQRSGPVRAVVIAIGLTVVSVLIFVVGLQLRLPVIGPWIPI